MEFVGLEVELIVVLSAVLDSVLKAEGSGVIEVSRSSASYKI